MKDRPASRCGILYPMAVGTERSSAWVFDRPLSRDCLFLLGVALGVVSIVGIATHWNDYGAGALVLSLALAFPWWLFLVGVVLGSIRSYLRARRGT